MSTYTVRYLTALGEIRTAEVQAASLASAKASFITRNLYRDDAAAPVLESVQAYYVWPLPGMKSAQPVL